MQRLYPFLRVLFVLMMQLKMVPNALRILLEEFLQATYLTLVLQRFAHILFQMLHDFLISYKFMIYG